MDYITQMSLQIKKLKLKENIKIIKNYFIDNQTFCSNKHIQIKWYFAFNPFQQLQAFINVMFLSLISLEAP